uniref:Uncharacterized protein n=1 Tax=Romanomermis culicivorax TaxID=13658 RepID=A0A915KHD3_ROMCU
MIGCTSRGLKFDWSRLSVKYKCRLTGGLLHRKISASFGKLYSAHNSFQGSPNRRQSSCTISSQLPNNSTSKLKCDNGSRLIKICGTF